MATISTSSEHAAESIQEADAWGVWKRARTSVAQWFAHERQAFPDDESRALFEAEDQRLTLRNLHVLCVIAMIVMPVAAILDFFVYPQHVAKFFALRLSCSALMGLVLWSARTEFARRHYRSYTVLAPMIPASFIAIMIALARDPGSSYYAGLTLCLVAIGFIFHWTYREGVYAACFVLCIYAAAAIPVLMSRPEQREAMPRVAANLIFILLNGVVIVAGSFFHHNIRVREFLSRLQLDRGRNALETTNRQLRELDRLKNDFLANVSHELRTPLTLLLAPLQSFRRHGLLPDNQARMVDNMHHQALRLLKLINDLLDIAKLQSGQLHLAYEVLNVGEFTRQLAESVGPLAAQRRIALEVEIDPGASTVEADREKLEKICLNLLFNAVKFTPDHGRVTITAAQEGSNLAVRIADTGVGIPADRLPFIFDRFWQGDSSSKRKHPGTGIGLALVKELAEAHGGSVAAESAPNHGTTMTVKIPLAAKGNRRRHEDTTRRALKPRALARPSAAEPAPIPPPPSPDTDWLSALYREAEFSPTQTAKLAAAQSGANSEDLTGPPGDALPLIVVADDEPAMRRFLADELGGACRLIDAVDGRDAVRQVERHQPDLLLLDYMMPEMDGMEVCRALRAEPRTRMIPIMLLTAKADEETRLLGLEAGANDVLVKPFSLVEFQTRVRNLLRNYSLQKDLENQKRQLEETLRQLRETEGQLVQSEKLASLGLLSAGIIHEINNPLNYANSALFLLSKKLRALPPEMVDGHPEIIRDIREGLHRVSTIVSDLRDFSHPDTGRRVAVNVAEVITSTLRLLAKRLKDERIETRRDVPDHLLVLANKNRLVQVMINLLQNACDALEGRPDQVIEIRAWEKAPGRIGISVFDNGRGIPPSAMGKLFDPFFTTKEIGKGTGLGLSICYRLIAEHDGVITVDSVEGRHTRFTLDLPAAEAHSLALSSTRQPAWAVTP